MMSDHKPDLLDKIKSGIATTDLLSAMLIEERECYTNNTIDQCASLLEKKNNLLVQLDKFAHDLAVCLGIDPSNEHTDTAKAMKSINEYDDNTRLMWESFIAKLNLCRKNNLTNGVIINQQLSSTRQLLCILRNEQDDPFVESYNKQGFNNNSLKSKTIARI